MSNQEIQRLCYTLEGMEAYDKGDFVEYENHQTVIASMQAKIDALMLEFCPNRMSKEQMAEWAKNQKPESLQALTDQAQTLDMGYGWNSCPTCGKSKEKVWIPWLGNDWPIEKSHFVDVKMRNGKIIENSSPIGYRWVHMDHERDNDIIAYREVK